MSLQDDYFDLTEDDTLPDQIKEKVERIWSALIDYENELEKLRPIVSGLRNSIRSLFEEND